MSQNQIRLRGACQNNLKNLDLDLPLGELIVVTGVSGSGKSSLAFDTIYAEGQRRYVETFSPYARQFLDRMDKPRVERIDGIPPAIAIDQTNPVRTSRSTVGTMTELTDHLKLLFARGARLYCRGCARPVVRDTPESTASDLLRQAPGARALITFTVAIPGNFTVAEIKSHLAAQGYTRFHAEEDARLEVIQDRLSLSPERRARLVESLEAAFKVGHGRLSAVLFDGQNQPLASRRYSSELHCAECDLAYHDPQPNLFSFNSPVGACDTCRGFGRVLGIDYALVIPDADKSLAAGAVKPFQTQSNRECQEDLLRFAEQAGIDVDRPWRSLSAAQRDWVIHGEGRWEEGQWYGVRGFFDWLEAKSYKMHIRVLLSKYRSYDRCPSCQGARLKPDALLWRLGDKPLADRVVPPQRRFRPAETELTPEQLEQLPGLCLHDLMLLPIDRCLDFFSHLSLPAPLDEAAEVLLGEIHTRLSYLVEVGLSYLNLDRQSRTLSGGEVQRINLTTALGTSLVNTLFVLDEPSIGLHPRDMGRVIGVLRRLRDAGNSLLVVEHDPQVMLTADRVLDIGPGPGKNGGQVVFFGTPAELLRDQRSLTAQYLRGDKSVGQPSAVPAGAEKPSTLKIRGAAAHNLKGLDVDLPLGRLVVVTGVSGSGKSTLVQDVLYQALCKLKGKPVDAPGAHGAILGHEQIGDVVLVDQSPIGRTTRSNPASYVGAFDAIRKAFAAELPARERGYTAGTFSFNSGHGRCPSCGGNGFEHVEMQFLSDVYLRCPDCDGRRYRAEILDIKLHPPGGGPGKSIAEVLDLTVAEALDFFAERPDILRGLEPLRAVGLDYLSLGQPVPTLSGGEAQRLKLAGHLAAQRGGKKPAAGTLFLFDEPTTGLHFDDIARLLGALRQLQGEGHSLLVIEHNLDIIAAADWIIDLGPEGGDAGGRLVCAGTPRAVMDCAASHTGAALRGYLEELRQTRAALPSLAPPAPATAPPTPPIAQHEGRICIHGAREHNLKNIDVCLPREQFTVITGMSGSGKSTLAFDILFSEGQRRYLESLNAYARQFVQPAARPDMDALFGIPPTVAIEQRTSRGGRKSTVATLTEIYHFLRLLFVKLGVQHCPTCAVAIEPQSREAIIARLLREWRARRVSLLAPLVTARKGYYTDLAKWAAGKGFSHLRVDGVDTPTDNWPRLDRFREHTIELPVGELRLVPEQEEHLRALLDLALDYGKGVVQVRDEQSSEAAIFSTRRACPGCGRSFEEPDPRLFSFNSKHGWCPGCFGTGLLMPGFDAEQSGEEIWWNAWWEGEEQPCPACEGRRLRPEALAVKFHGRDIAELSALSIAAAEKFFQNLELAGREADIARDILAELGTRFAFLREVGLSYLSLDRAAPTLSGGEAQRIRLAAQLGSNLRGVCYILDEPTIGLHPRDNLMLLDTLEKLGAKGNTVVVVEHDDETIRRARHLIDLGPGAGINGGRVVAAGSVEDLMASPQSVTGRFLANPLRHPLVKRRSTSRRTPGIEISGAHLHNLKKIDVVFPLKRLIAVSGVSGSGKSTLVRSVLHENLRRLLAERGNKTAPPRGCGAIKGAEKIARILEVDQTPIGKTPRSCPATYVGFWDEVRKLFAATPEAKIRGWGPGRFSFNTKEGRCSACDGQGVQKIEMSFLPDVQVSCDQCAGLRFTPETLAVTYKDRNIGEVLKMTINQAADFFAAHGKIHHALCLLQDVGLGYLTLGQPSPTLSGGEAQRIKLVTELAKTPLDEGAAATRNRRGGHTLYILDEPTIGLHMADVEKLIRVLHRLVAAGNTLVVIEHNLDVIAEADWLIDLGPEGGEGGGRLVAAGTPEQVARADTDSRTAPILKKFLQERRDSK
ncbi:excinuclease ABC subunit UvrA [Geoalkalibacter halelectricus]|uniref:excinuclease ABC subunit UvrA n=1 Tax=Geoalkalibacter halelectricus TaxID=2847045 RepID=UPI00266F2885|nr:excinuclease ABC subunit UvrA [Geoalkalibacter halelectricus]